MCSRVVSILLSTAILCSFAAANSENRLPENSYDVKDISLTTKGQFKIEWAEQEMSALRVERVRAMAWELYLAPIHKRAS